MNNYFTLTVEEQQQVLQAAEGRIGLPAQAIEKDLWVTTILQIVFTLPFADKLIFKGGLPHHQYRLQVRGGGYTTCKLRITRLLLFGKRGSV